MKEWDLVFRTGRHTDGNGKVKDWTVQDLDNIVAKFNPAFHEPPLVIGHPSDNAPAFGYVEAIKRVGNDLYLKYHQVADEFREWVGKGLYKKKSIAVYPDGSLRHIGYLGAMPPAIKGLPDYQFNDADKGALATYEFCDWRMGAMGRIFMRIRDYLVEKEGADKADNIISAWDVQDLLTPPPPQEQVGDDSLAPNFNEEDEMTKEEIVGIVNDTIKTFSEQLTALGETMKGLTAQFSELQTAQGANLLASQERAFSEFLMTPAMQKRIPEAQRAATVSHLMSLVAAPAIEFGEGDQKKSVSAVDSYKEQLGKLPEVVEFKEVATQTRAGESLIDGLDAVAIAQKATEFKESEAKAGREISVTEAVSHVTKKGV